MNQLFKNTLIVVKSGGDLATGVAYRLKRSGFPLIMTELATPMFVRRTVAFGEAVYSGEATVEGITARLVYTPEEADQLARRELIPILIDPTALTVSRLKPAVVIDAIMAKTNTGTTIADASLVIALGPGFTAGQDCHAVIETNRGHSLGRVLYTGQAEPNTNTPGMIKGYSIDRVLRAPANGHVKAYTTIGERLQTDQLIASLNGNEIRASFDGVLRGLIHSKVRVRAGLKIGDLDPRGNIDHCFTISDKALAIGGGVLEAILASNILKKDTDMKQTTL